MVIRGILLLSGYVTLLWKGLPLIIQDVLINQGIVEEKLVFLDKINGAYWWIVGSLVAIHILLAFITPRAVIKKLCKNGYVPYSEIDTQLLIKHNLAKVGTLCYLSSFKAIDGVQGKIKMGNSKNLEKELEELKQLLKDGMISKDEYETKRAMAIMRSGSKK